MGSKRSSSKAPKEPSTSPPAAPPADENFQSLQSHNPESPYKSQKKPKLSNPKSTDTGILSPVLPTKGMKHKLSTSKPADSGFLPPIPSTDSEAPSQNNNRKGKAADISNEISPRDGRASRSTSIHWGQAYNLKFLESFVAFRLKHGFLPTASKMTDLLTEINDWAPYTLSEKNLYNKIRHFRFLFQKKPELGPESSEYERTFHQLGSQLWGPGSSKAKGSAAGARHKDASKEKVKVAKRGDRKGQKEKEASKKLNVKKKNADADKEYVDDEEEEEGDDENDKGGDEKVVQTMEVESGKEHEKVGAWHKDGSKEEVKAKKKGNRKGQGEKVASKKLNDKKKTADADKEYEDDDEEEEGDDENDEGGDEKVVQTMEVEIGKEHAKVVARHKDASKEEVKAEKKGDRKGQGEKAASKKLNDEKKTADADKECEDDEEEEEGGDENDEGGDEKVVQTMEVESGKEHEKVDLLVGEDNGLLDGDVTKFPYKYLKLALEEYWTEAKLNMNTLYSALPKVDPVQAKLLDEQYSEVFKGMLKLKMKKNETFNKIIRSSLGR